MHDSQHDQQDPPSTVDPCPTSFLTNPQAPTANSHTDVFLASSHDDRLVAQLLVTQNTMTPPSPPPSSYSVPALTKSLSTRRKLRKRCSLYAGGSPCFAICIPTCPSVSPVPPPWCQWVAMESSEIYYNMCICRQDLHNFSWGDDSKLVWKLPSSVSASSHWAFASVLSLRPNVGNVRAQRHLPRLIQPALHIHILVAFTPHIDMCVCYVTPCVYVLPWI